MIASNDPTYGASIQLIQQVTGASPATARRWKAHPDKMPPCAARLTRFAVFGDLGEILGPDWQGFGCSREKIYPPFFHGGFTAAQICAMFFEVRELRWLRYEVKRLSTDLRNHQDNTWALDKLRALGVAADHVRSR